MKHPLETYRRIQREIRAEFEGFTRKNCATCPTPCCRRPARILPTDILLAEASGWKSSLPQDQFPAHLREGEESASVIAGRIMEAFSDAPGTAEGGDNDEPCEFLGENGCTFPTDLRPFGCTAYICKYMYERLHRPTLTKIKRLARELDEAHSDLLRALYPPKPRRRGRPSGSKEDMK